MEPLVGGLDIGSRSIKVVVLRGMEVVGLALASTGSDPVSRAGGVLREACGRAGVELEALTRVVGTGYGRSALSVCTSTVTEISCHATANHHTNNAVRTVLDMGGQDCKVIRCDQQGRVLAFVMNDKCAAGTGRYLEKVARTLEIPIDELGERSLLAIERPAPITRFCPIFVQQEIVHLLRTGGYAVNEILAGACDSVVDYIVKLVHRIGVEGAFAISGGIAQNAGIVTRVERKLKVRAYLAEHPQMMGALGAALLARKNYLKEK
ncbi:MAG: acyl-CoA dehydratase activase [Rhodoferax sp.]|uniref:acyl-CoA dehydratase activase n=1 Tax=Rhodoferax sp. TaxID=50421 RepID=UPI002637E7FF|nr:acyl-CoA dehydratase activase [Rhodoferax sp.]MDD5335394.1 acyl-CoA dehydratase activase [Rhodoferax sp.]